MPLFLAHSSASLALMQGSTALGVMNEKRE
jgi:hypothetical protein